MGVWVLGSGSTVHRRIPIVYECDVFLMANA